MSIDFVVAKVRHQTLGDALKLLPLVRAVDAVGLEGGLISEERAFEIEQYFKRAYLLPPRRRKFEALRLLAKAVYRHQNGFNPGLDSILFYYGKPVIMIEKHPLKDIEMLKELDNKTNIPLSKYGAIQTVKEDACRIFYDAAQAHAEQIRIRDHNMAENIGAIEQRMLELYSHLSSKPQIRCLLTFGSLHHVDRILGIPSNAVVNFSPTNSYKGSPSSVITRIMLENASFEACKADILRHYR